MDNFSDSSKGFIGHVFRFDDNSKADILNISQYALFSIIPIVIFNKIMQRYVPEVDERKSSVEVLAEIILQVIAIFFSLFFIHRLITFIPPYSGEPYADFSFIGFILAILLILFSIQTKLGEKANLLVERLTDAWNGTSSSTTSKKNKKGQQQQQQQQQPQGSITGLSMGQTAGIEQGTPMPGLPSVAVSTAMQPLPNYNNMYQDQPAPMIGAATPGGDMEGFGSYEPQAANGVLGNSGSFGSW